MKKTIASPLRAQLILLIMWVIVQIILYSTTGIKIANDSPRYIYHAHQLMEESIIPQGHNFWYLGYISFLAFLFSLNLSYKYVVLVQILISGFALLALYQSTLKITRNDYAIAFLAGFFYLSWPKIQLFNYYILTDSFFTSMIIVSFYLLLCIKHSWNTLFFFPLLIFTVLIRPNGIALLLASGAYAFSFLFLKNRKLALKMGLFAFPLAMVAGIVLLNKMLLTFNIIETYTRGEVIFLYKGVLVQGGEFTKPPSPSADPLFKILYFIFFNPVYFLKLSLLKLFYFFMSVKPYYSLIHNLFLLLLFPIYFFAIRGAIDKRIEASVKNFIFCLIFIQALTVMLTVEDWDGRFLIPVLPFVFILAAAGIVGLFKKYCSSTGNIIKSKAIKILS